MVPSLTAAAAMNRDHSQQHPQLQLQKQQQQQQHVIPMGGGAPRRASTASSGRGSNKAGSDVAKEHMAATEGRSKWNKKCGSVMGKLHLKSLIKYLNDTLTSQLCVLCTFSGWSDIIVTGTCRSSNHSYHLQARSLSNFTESCKFVPSSWK